MELNNLSATEIGHLVGEAKALKPSEVIDWCKDYLDKVNPKINAFTYVNWEDAYADANELEAKIMAGEDVGPLAGVPIGLKDFLPSKKGWPATHGGVPYSKTIDHVDGSFYRTARKLGAIAIGKTNAPAFGFRGTTDNLMFGPTSTPFNTEYNSGGSSGGSAAAVGAGIVPLAEGGDAGGSIRIPSAWCNCFGFKPSAGLVPSICRPDAWTATHPFCCGGPITRTVKDAAVMMNAMQKYNPKDPISQKLNYIEFVDRHIDTSQLTVGITFNFDLFPEPDSSIRELMEEVVETLKEYDVVVKPIVFSFKHTREEIENAWLGGISVDTAIDFNLDPENYERMKQDLPAQFIYWKEQVDKWTIMDYRNFNEVRTDILDAHLKVFEECDLIISPVTGCLPVKNTDDHDTKGPNSINGQTVDPLIGFGYTYLENMIGYPAASVPIGTVDGLPVGLQIIGKRFEDDKVFDLAYTLEYVCPWKDLYPEL